MHHLSAAQFFLKDRYHEANRNAAEQQMMSECSGIPQALVYSQSSAVRPACRPVYRLGTAVARGRSFDIEFRPHRQALH